METQSLTFHKRSIKEGFTGLGYCPAGFESHHDVQAGFEHLLFLPQPPTRRQFRASTALACVSSLSELATGPPEPS